MLEITQPFIRAIQLRNMHYKHESLPNGTDRVIIAFSGNPSPKFQLLFNEELSSVSIHTVIPVQFKEQLPMLLALNRLNTDYRFIKLYLESESNRIHMRTDSLITADTSSFICIQLLKSSLAVLKEITPILQHAAQ